MKWRLRAHAQYCAIVHFKLQIIALDENIEQYYRKQSVFNNIFSFNVQSMKSLNSINRFMTSF